MAVGALLYALLMGLSGDVGSAAFGIAIAVASLGFVILAGKMRNSDKARADLLPPKVR